MKNKRETIYWALLIIWSTGIFIMSNQPANISDYQSGGIIQMLANIGIDMNSIFGKFANFVVRKCAHFLEYMVLALLSFNVLNLYFNMRKVATITIAFVFVYACSDEIHQLFVLGREGSIRDVVIDTLGGITFVLIKVCNFYIFNRNRLNENVI